MFSSYCGEDQAVADKLRTFYLLKCQFNGMTVWQLHYIGLVMMMMMMLMLPTVVFGSACYAIYVKNP